MPCRGKRDDVATAILLITSLICSPPPYSPTMPGSPDRGAAAKHLPVDEQGTTGRTGLASKRRRSHTGRGSHALQAGRGSHDSHAGPDRPAAKCSSHWVQVTLRIGNKWIKLRPEGTMLRQPHLQIIAARKSTRMCSVVPQYTKDHLKSIIFLPPDWSVNDTTQMILGIMVHRQRVTSSSLGWCPPPKNPNKLLQTSSEI